VTGVALALDLQSGTASCPVVDGIHFPNGTFVPLRWMTDEHLSAASAVSVPADATAASLDVSFSVEQGEFLVVGGGGAWEGEGFLAAMRSGTILWLLYLEDSEPFAEARIERGMVIGRAGDYPTRTEFMVPLLSPAWVKVTPLAVG
jgi:hypothetical protein